MARKATDNPSPPPAATTTDTPPPPPPAAPAKKSKPAFAPTEDEIKAKMAAGLSRKEALEVLKNQFDFDQANA